MWQQSAGDDYSVYILVVYRGFVSVSGRREARRGRTTRECTAWSRAPVSLPDRPRSPPPQGYTLQVSEKTNDTVLPHRKEGSYILHVAQRVRRWWCSRFSELQEIGRLNCWIVMKNRRFWSSYFFQVNWGVFSEKTVGIETFLACYSSLRIFVICFILAQTSSEKNRHSCRSWFIRNILNLRYAYVKIRNIPVIRIYHEHDHHVLTHFAMLVVSEEIMK